jgi:hypothetical protein
LPSKHETLSSNPSTDKKKKKKKKKKRKERKRILDTMDFATEKSFKEGDSFTDNCHCHLSLATEALKQKNFEG